MCNPFINKCVSAYHSIKPQHFRGTNSMLLSHQCFSFAGKALEAATCPQVARLQPGLLLGKAKKRLLGASTIHLHRCFCLFWLLGHLYLAGTYQHLPECPFSRVAPDLVVLQAVWCDVMWWWEFTQLRPKQQNNICGWHKQVRYEIRCCRHMSWQWHSLSCTSVMFVSQ